MLYTGILCAKTSQHRLPKGALTCTCVRYTSTSHHWLSLSLPALVPPVYSIANACRNQTCNAFPVARKRQRPSPACSPHVSRCASRKVLHLYTPLASTIMNAHSHASEGLWAMEEGAGACGVLVCSMSAALFLAVRWSTVPGGGGAAWSEVGEAQLTF